MTKGTPASEGLILGEFKNGQVVIQHESSTISNRNVFVAGGPGSFKTQSYVLPNVVNSSQTSIIVTDPKGEVYELTNEIKKAQGYHTIVMNFKDFSKSARYNPLLYIRKSSDTNKIADVIVSSKNDPRKKDFWYNAQMSLLNSLIKYVYFEYEPSGRTIEGILDFLEEFDPRYNKQGISELDQQFEQLPDGHEAKRSYHLGFHQAQSEVRPNIMISLLTTLQDFIDEEVATFTSTNDFFFEELGIQKICLYVLISPLDKTWEGLINLFFQQLFSELYFLGDKHNAKLPQPCVMILDEFVNLGYFLTYEQFLATCRGYGISVSTIVQSIPQLQDLYNDKKAKAIIGNHAIKICLGGVEETTAEYFSRLVGDTTIKVFTGSSSQSKASTRNNQQSGSTSEQYSYQRRRLITEGEIINLQESEDGRKSIVVIQGKPFLLRKTPQFELYGDLLSENRVSQQTYVPEQTKAAQVTLTEMENDYHLMKETVAAKLAVYAQKQKEKQAQRKPESTKEETKMAQESKALANEVEQQFAQEDKKEPVDQVLPF